MATGTTEDMADQSIADGIKKNTSMTIIRHVIIISEDKRRLKMNLQRPLSMNILLLTIQVIQLKYQIAQCNIIFLSTGDSMTSRNPDHLFITDHPSEIEKFKKYFTPRK